MRPASGGGGGGGGPPSSPAHSETSQSGPATVTNTVFDLIKRGEWEGVRPLVQHGTEGTLKDSETGWSALHALAVSRTVPDDLPAVMDRLIGTFSVDAHDSAIALPTPLFVAVRTNAHVAIVRHLLDRGANPNARCFQGQTPVFVAAQTPCAPAVMELLLARGGDPGLLADDGASPLHVAAACGDVRILELLLRVPGQATRVHECLKDKLGRVVSTPLLVAAATGSFDAVQLLLEHGCDPHLARHDGFSPLIAATCSQAGCSLVEMLLLRCEASAPAPQSQPPPPPQPMFAATRLAFPCIPAARNNARPASGGAATFKPRKSALEIARAKDLPGEYINVLSSPSGRTDVLSWGDLMDTPAVASQFVVVRRLSDRQRVFSARRKGAPRGDDARVLKVSSRANEAAHLARVMGHTHVVGFYGVVLHEPEPVLEMAWYCETLHDTVRRRGALDEAKVRLACAQMHSALEHVHRHGLVHLDVKPKNIFVHSSAHLVLGDFGSSMQVPVPLDAELSVTTEFSAPEVLRQKPVPESDWWSLGCTAYVLSTGKLAGPFDAERNWKLTRDNIFDLVIAPFPATTPPGLQALVLALLKTDPEARALLPDV